ncbi:MAG: hypothetical protein AAF196_00655 [Planctomycetota bacterium]
MSDDFFIGYADTSAPGHRRQSLRAGLAFLVLGLGATALIAANQSQPIQGANFEFGNVETFRGLFVAEPVPMLCLAERDPTTKASVFLLVDEWKFGIDEEQAKQLHLKQVELQGTRIYVEGGQAMLEAVSSSIREADTPDVIEVSEPVPLGEHTLEGEIVDSKCYLGVMNPGTLKTHRACAIHCIRGGIPPILLVRADDGTRQEFVLVGPDGEAVNDRVLDHVAAPIRIRGQVERSGPLLVLKADPAAIERLDR